jgi:UDP-glucose 4-epimerase
MAILITGVAGFIGSNLAGILVGKGEHVFGVDNFSRGSLNNLDSVMTNSNFTFEKVDLTNKEELLKIVGSFQAQEKISEVWHLAANSDIPAGVEDPEIDLKDTFMSTFGILDAMKAFDIPIILFASSSAVYGDHGDVALVENLGPLLPVSNYGAMKLASEAAISAAAESFLGRAYIYRFPNVVGVPATHGVMLDFVRKLKITPKELHVLGDGTQQKGYLHVEELIDAMLLIQKKSNDKVSIFNVGADDEGISVRVIAEETVRMASPGAGIKYGKGNKGWVGDVPKFVYSINKLKMLGWTPKLSSEQAVLKAIHQIVKQEINYGK